MYRGILAVLVGALAIGAVAVGCGGGGSPTKAEFIERADAICQMREEERQAGFLAAPQPGSNASPREIGVLQKRLITTVVLPSIQAEFEELADLNAPSGEEAKVGAIIEAYGEIVKEAEERPYTVGKYAKYDRLTAEYGLNVCHHF